MPFWEKQKGSFSNAARVKAQEERQAAYDKEYNAAKKKAYAREAKEQLRREGLSDYQRRKEDFKAKFSSVTKVKGRVAQDLGSSTNLKNKIYKNLGGNIRVNSNALSRLKRIGR